MEQNDFDIVLQGCDQLRVYDDGAGYLLIEQRTASAPTEPFVVAVPFDRLEHFIEALKRHIPV